MIEVLAVLCAAAAAWTLLTPSPASHRLDRLTSPKPSNPLRPLRTRIETFREHRTRPQRRRTAVIELCDAMAAELAAAAPRRGLHSGGHRPRPARVRRTPQPASPTARPPGQTGRPTRRRGPPPTRGLLARRLRTRRHPRHRPGRPRKRPPRRGDPAPGGLRPTGRAPARRPASWPRSLSWAWPWPQP